MSSQPVCWLRMPAGDAAIKLVTPALANHTAHGSLPRFGQFALTCSRWGWSAGAGFGRFASLGDVRGIASALLVATFALCPVLEARLVVVVEILTVRTLFSP